ncbi:hypothetical protein [Selenomonas ruminantium]|uniref:Helix-turn-helix domain-containing protein n=1 Tax=Selenomonas ruminantium TaxID=971 RepID=A0A1H0SJW8_SELRU|nr:hypothetical protein [Selenomonas ruminantium]SDP42043.1 hypothetical protein SAMN05216366_11825 [Selenomonas ruminantium]
MISSNPKQVLLLRTDLAAKVGRVEALLLSQLDYWLERTHNFAAGRFWVYNTEAEWARQLGVSVSSIHRASQSLERQGLIVRQRHNRLAYDQTLSYSVCYDALGRLGFPGGRRGFVAGQETPSADPWDRPLADDELYAETEAGA